MPVITQAVSAEVTLSTILSDIGTFFEAAIGWLGKALDTVTGSPEPALGVNLPSTVSETELF